MLLNIRSRILALNRRSIKSLRDSNIYVFSAIENKRLIATNVNEGLKTKLEEIFGSENVSISLPIKEAHGRDESYHRTYLPDVVVFPQSVDQVSQCARLCNNARIPLIPYGSGTGMEGGVAAVQGGVSMDLMKMNSIVSYHPDDFDITVEPGVHRIALNDHIKANGLWFPVDPGADASLCGMAATSASGTNAVRYGTMRENVMNLEVVLADGRVIHTAGPNRRAKKTAAGYNLTNLFVGSEGTLGIITKATLKLHPIPESIVSAVSHFPTIDDAVTTTVNVLHSGVPIAKIELLDEVSMRACNLYSKLDYLEKPTLFLEFHGTKQSVTEQAEIVGELAAANNGSNFRWSANTEERNKLWKARHMFYYAGKALIPNCRGISTDVCVPISELPEVLIKTKEDIIKSTLTGPIIGHVGDGNFHSLLLYTNDEQFAIAKKLANKMAERALAVGGTCTGEHGVGIGKRHLLPSELGESTIAVMKSLKAMLDPNGILNPGKKL